MSYQPRVRDIAHLGSVELFTPRLAETTDFFVRLMSLDEVARHGDSVYLHAWDDYQAWTVKITQRDLPGIAAPTCAPATPTRCGVVSMPWPTPVSPAPGATTSRVRLHLGMRRPRRPRVRPVLGDLVLRGGSSAGAEEPGRAVPRPGWRTSAGWTT